MYLVRRKGDKGVYFIRYRGSDGKRHEISTRTTNHREARRIMREEMQRSASGPQQECPTVSQFLDEAIARHRAHQTREAERYAFLAFQRACGDVRLDAIDFRLLEKFKRAREAQGRKPATINNNLAHLSSALTYAVEMGYLQARPRIRKVRLNDPLPRWLTAEEQAKLLEKAAGTEMERFLRIGLRTGMRPGEIRELLWRDVDFVQALIVVRGSSEGTKGRRDRTVPLTGDLREYLLDGGPGQPDEHLIALSKDEVENWFERHATDSPHVLRHSYGKEWVEAGGNLRVLKEVLGHKSLKTTERYAHFAPDIAQREAAKLPALPGRKRADVTPIAEARRVRA
jgi:integrase